jgi:hypothetical protein
MKLAAGIEWKGAGLDLLKLEHAANQFAVD